jgi:hypothetical protein
VAVGCVVCNVACARGCLSPICCVACVKWQTMPTPVTATCTTAAAFMNLPLHAIVREHVSTTVGESMHPLYTLFLCVRNNTKNWGRERRGTCFTWFTLEGTTERRRHSAHEVIFSPDLTFTHSPPLHSLPASDADEPLQQDVCYTNPSRAPYPGRAYPHT